MSVLQDLFLFAWVFTFAVKEQWGMLLIPGKERGSSMPNKTAFM